MTRQLLSLGFFIILAICVCSDKARGEERPLFTIAPLQGDVELVGEHRDDSHGIGNDEIKSRANNFEEILHLKTQGSVYHENFLSYTASGGIGLAEQDVHSDISSGSNTGTLDEYNVVAEFLKLKPYPVTVYTNKSQDIVERQFLGPLKTDTENSGVSAAFRSKDWPMRFQFGTSKTNQESLFETSKDFLKRDATNFKYALGHNFSELSRLNFDYSHDDVTQEGVGATIKTKQDRYVLSHDLSFGKDAEHRLDSFFSYLNQTGTVSFDNLQWEERLTLQHTPSFLTNYDFRFTDTTIDLTRNQETRGLIGFEHRLFESLVTTGSIFASQTTIGDGGSSDQQGGSLAFNYHKKNPWGTLYLTYSVTLIETKFTGAGHQTAGVVGEQHTFHDPFLITLDKRNIDTSTISVTDSTGTIPYTAGNTVGSDFDIIVVGDLVQLRVIPGGRITDGQLLLVNYRYATESSRDDTTVRQDFTIRQAFENGLGLYGAHRQQDQTISTTDTTVKPDEFKINTLGADFTHKGLFLLAEVTKEDSTQIPSTSKRVDGRYSWPLNIDTTATLYASNDWLKFGAPDNRDVTLFRTGAEVLTRLTQRYSLSGRIDYRDEDDSRFGLTKGFQFISELRYTYRQFLVTTGVELNSLTRTGDRNRGDYIYLRIKRFF